MKNQFYSKWYHYFLNHGTTRLTKYIYHYLSEKNPAVQTRINGQKIWLPFCHKLPYYQKEHKNYDRQIGKICRRLRGGVKSINVINVGANVGDTIINIGIMDGNYIAIEGEKLFFRLLQTNLKKYHVYMENLYLTDCDNEQNYTSIGNNGTSRLSKSDKGDCSMMTLDKLMKSRYPKFHADILVVDTDGFDFRVIRGADQYLRSEKPLIYFEWCKELLDLQGEDAVSIFPYLSGMGYDELILYDNVGNIVTALHADDLLQLKLLAEYSVNQDRQICYYDVLAIHRDSEYDSKSFINIS